MADTEYYCKVCDRLFRSARALRIHQSRTACLRPAATPVGETQFAILAYFLKLAALAFCLVENISFCMASYFLAAYYFDLSCNPKLDITPFIIIYVKECLDPFVPYSGIIRWVQTREFTRAVNWVLRK